jgi:hypothetical protein
VVRDRIELSTFRFSGRGLSIIQPLAEVSVADVRPLRERMTSRVAARAHETEGPAGCGTDRLTDLLTRRYRTGETARDVDDGHRPDSLVSETRRDTGDVGDVRRGAHNPATTGRLVTAEVTATTPHNDSPGLIAATAHCELMASRQVAALN